MITQKKYGKHKNLKIPCENHENHENHKMILENHKQIIKIIEFHTRITKNLKILKF